MKKLWAAFVSIMLTVTLAAGCGNSAGQRKKTEEEGTVKLTFWAGLTGDDQQAMADMVEQFNNEQDQIEVDFYSVT